jgi:hypothetical protein
MPERFRRVNVLVPLMKESMQMHKSQEVHDARPGDVSDQASAPTGPAAPPTHNGDVSGSEQQSPPQGDVSGSEQQNPPQGDAGQGKSPGSAQPVNILHEVEAMSGSSKPRLRLVQLGENESAVIPFTADGVKVEIHYCPEPEIKAYVLCNGPDCVLCRIGRKKDGRNLIPVYLPTTGDVAVLPVSPSLRPHALLPQLANVLKAGQPMLMFITRRQDRFTVSTRALEEDVDGGEDVIEVFKAEFDAGRIDLASVYSRIPNEQLAMLPEVARMLALKGGVPKCGN